MNSLIGFFVTCTFNVSLYILTINTYVSQEISPKCLVVDDQLMEVGGEDYSFKPMLVDCSSDSVVKQLKVQENWPIIMTGDQCE